MHQLDPMDFYDPWHGHEIDHLKTLVTHLRSSKEQNNRPRSRSLVFFIGDSSLDNKAWVGKRDHPRHTGVASAFKNPQLLKVDVAHNLNKIFHEQGLSDEWAAVNCAVEATTLAERDRGKSLWAQDEFVRDNISENDVLIISIGGNDVALRPSCCTICSMCCLTCCASQNAIDDGSACGFGHMKDLLRDDYLQYVKAIISKTRPALIVPTMIYYPDENPKSPSWANWLLKTIRYDSNPKKIQSLIDRMFVDCLVPMPELIQKFEREKRRNGNSVNQTAAAAVQEAQTTQKQELLNGDNNTNSTRAPMIVSALEWSKVLDGKVSKDYVARVEPSVAGGLKMAQLIAQLVAEKMMKQKRDALV